MPLHQPRLCLSCVARCAARCARPRGRTRAAVSRTVYTELVAVCVCCAAGLVPEVCFHFRGTHTHSDTRHTRHNAQWHRTSNDTGQDATPHTVEPAAQISWGRAHRCRRKVGQSQRRRKARGRRGGSAWGGSTCSAAPPQTPLSSLRRKSAGGGHTDVAASGPSLRRKKARGRRGGGAEALAARRSAQPAAQITTGARSPALGTR